jgi:hypothetical protein
MVDEMRCWQLWEWLDGKYGTGRIKEKGGGGGWMRGVCESRCEGTRCVRGGTSHCHEEGLSMWELMYYCVCLCVKCVSEEK